MNDIIDYKDCCNRINEELGKLRVIAFEMEEKDPFVAPALMSLINVMLVISSQLMIMLSKIGD